MKRCAISREELVLHEASHLVAIAITPDLAPADFVWQRLPDYEIAHIEPVLLRHFEWETPAERNALIVKRAVVALAGGAAVADGVLTQGRAQASISIETIHQLVGSTDFDLAHEWLTLQRYDPDQRSIELEIKRLFQALHEVFLTPPHRAALNTISQRIFEELQAADASGLPHLTLSSQRLLADLSLEPFVDFTLETTLLRKNSAEH